MTTYIIMYYRYDYLCNRLAHYIISFSKKNTHQLWWLYCRSFKGHISNERWLRIRLSIPQYSRSTIHVMNQELISWALYDLSGARTPDLETMQDYFRCLCGLRGKSLEGIAYDALQNSWCVFIRRWNRMLDDMRSFPQWFANREDLQGTTSVVIRI